MGGDLLSSLKQEAIELDRKKALLEAQKLKYSWINPINMRYGYQKGDQFPNQEFQSFSIEVNQPIFKSGGIWEAIVYAKRVKKGSLLGVVAQKRELISKVIDTLYLLKETKLQIKRQKLQIKNAALDIKIKKEQYLAGEIDSTFLDDAILKHNRTKLTLLDLKEKEANLEELLKNLSDVDFSQIRLPKFSLVRQKDFVKKNIYLAQQKAQKEAKRALYRMSIARYLPTLSLVASQNYQKSRGSLYFPGYSYKDHYHTYGFRVSMPLFDINALRNIEIAKIDYLKANNSLLELKRQKRNAFKKALKELKILDKKILLAKEDEKLYKKLALDTKAKLEAGEKTIYDLEIMKNSYKMRRLEQKIYTMQKQQILLRLYKEVEDAKF